MVLTGSVAIGCGSNDDRGAVIAYAEGDWSCQDPDLPEAIVATVTAKGDAEGRVEITFPWPADPFTDPEGEDLVIAGAWRLDNDELAVRWDDPRWGSADVAPISLDAEEIRTRSGNDDEEREWVTVNVDRSDHSITFDAAPPDGERVRLSCEKA